MYIKDGMCYGEEPLDPSVVNVRPLKDQILLLTFDNGEKKFFDTKKLKGAVFEPLKNEEVFITAEVDHGTVQWLGGLIDIAPETLYRKG